jgi:hypothetical protein
MGGLVATAGGGGGAPTTAQYLTLATDGTLTSERVATAGGGLTGTDGGAGGAWTLAVGAGTGITVNADDIAVTYASQAEMEAASATNRAVNPSVQHHHPSSVKKWIRWNSAGTIALDYGCSTVTDHAAGSWTVNFDTAFSTANYAVATCSGMSGATAGCDLGFSQTTSPAAGSCRLQGMEHFGGTLVDPTVPDIMTAVFCGDH